MRSWGHATAVSAFAPNTLSLGAHMTDECLSFAYSHSLCPQCVSVTTQYF